MNNTTDKTLTRYIGSKNVLDEKGMPQSSAFVKRKTERGISVWDITNYLAKNDEIKIFKLGDEKFAKNPPYTIARCDLTEKKINKVFEELQNEFRDIDYKLEGKFLSAHKDICFNANCNPAIVYHVAQALLDVSEFKKRPKEMDYPSNTQVIKSSMLG